MAYEFESAAIADEIDQRQAPKLIYKSKLEALTELVAELSQSLHRNLRANTHPRTGELELRIQEFVLAEIESLNTALLCLYEVCGGQER